MLRLAQTQQKGDDSLLCIGFNQDGSCVYSAEHGKIRIYSCENNQTCFELDVDHVHLMAMLYCTSLLAFTGTSEKYSLTLRTVVFYNTHTHAIIARLSFPTAVLNIMMNRKYVFIVLENQICVYKIEGLEQVVSCTTQMNPKGVCAITTNAQDSWMAFPDDVVRGRVKATKIGHDASAADEVFISAHRSPIACMQWNSTGKMLATASVHGTVIRIWSMPDGTKLFSLKRGHTPASITGMSFASCKMFAVASCRGSIHFYRLVKVPVDYLHNPKKSLHLESRQKILKIALGCEQGTSIALHFKSIGSSEDSEKVEIMAVTSQGVLIHYELTHCDVATPENPIEYNVVGQWKVTER